MQEVFTPWQRFCLWFCNTFADWYLEREYSRGYQNHRNGYAYSYKGRPVLIETESACCGWMIRNGCCVKCGEHV